MINARYIVLSDDPFFVLSLLVFFLFFFSFSLTLAIIFLNSRSFNILD